MIKVNEIFWSIQGEGGRTGQATTFIRTSGCNLKCSFCDTDHTSRYHKLDEESIMEIVRTPMVHGVRSADWVCVTGGEPFLWDLEKLFRLLHKENYKIQVETNGSIFMRDQVLDLIDWLTLSPKVGFNNQPQMAAVFEQYFERANEIKILVDKSEPFSPSELLSWLKLVLLRRLKRVKAQVYLQPIDNKPANVRRALEFIKEVPSWRLSVQTHKLIGVK